MPDDRPHVYAFHPRARDAPHYIAEDREGLVANVGAIVGAEQCDACGNSCYHLIADGRIFYARCTDDPDLIDRDDPDAFRGCGTRYPIGLYPDDDVAFTTRF